MQFNRVSSFQLPNWMENDRTIEVAAIICSHMCLECSVQSCIIHRLILRRSPRKDTVLKEVHSPSDHVESHVKQSDQKRNGEGCLRLCAWMAGSVEAWKEATCIPDHACEDDSVANRLNQSHSTLKLRITNLCFFFRFWSFLGAFGLDFRSRFTSRLSCNAWNLPFLLPRPGPFLPLPLDCSSSSMTPSGARHLPFWDYKRLESKSLRNYNTQHLSNPNALAFAHPRGGSTQ